MIGIVNAGIGNIASIRNMFKKIGTEVLEVTDEKGLTEVSALVLPGVGAFDYGMERLENSGLLEGLHHRVMVEQTPILGICLGAQLLGKRSEEGVRPGLGWIDMEVQKFPKDPKLRVPHMGWNVVQPTRSDGVFSDTDQELRYYFVHSYYMKTEEKHVAAYTSYGFSFASAVQSGHIFGVQFHPEKSHRYGAALLKRFTEVALCSVPV